MGAVAKAEVFWRAALQGIRHQPFPHAVAVLTLAIALFALGLGRAGSGAIDHLLASLGSDVQVTVWLKSEASPAGVDALVASLRGRGFTVQLVTPRAALERLGRELGAGADAFRGLGSDPLPPSLEVGVPPAWRDPASLRLLAQELLDRAEVTQVDWGQAAVERLGALAPGAALGWRVRLFSPARCHGGGGERHAPAGDLRPAGRGGNPEAGGRHRPLRARAIPHRGLLQGLAGAALALLGLAVVLHVVAPQLQALFAFLQVPSASTTLWGLPRTLELLGVGAGLGLLGSFLAVSRALRA